MTIPKAHLAVSYLSRNGNMPSYQHLCNQLRAVAVACTTIGMAQVKRKDIA